MSAKQRDPNAMQPEQHEPEIRRIVVALDGTEQSKLLLEAAAILAQNLGIELVGLFVEDINLLRLAELPFTYEFGSFSSQPRPVQTLLLERQLRAQANSLRRMLMRVAHEHDLPWSFQVMRGMVATEVQKATSDTDLIIVGRSRRTRSGVSPLGSTTRALLVQATPRLTFVLHRQARWKQPILVGYDGLPAARRALFLATRLLQEQDTSLVIVLMGEDAESASELRQEAAQWLHQHGLRARYRWLARANIARLVNLVLVEQGGAFVLPSDGLDLQDAALLSVLDLLQCPVLLVR